MKVKATSTINLMLFFFCFFSCREETVTCLIATELGDIEVVLYPKRAPITAKNFLSYVEKGAYNGSSFFRVCTPENESDREIKIEVIQGGNVSEDLTLPPIPIETTEMTGLTHNDGVVSMARSNPHSAQSSFFICIGDQPELDFGGKRNPDGQGFAAFGKVTSGMDVVLLIQKQNEVGQYLVNPVEILNVIRINP